MSDAPDQTKTTRVPLLRINLDVHMQQVIRERLNLGHLYSIEDGEACCKPAAASSIWRLVQEEVERAGWRLIPKGTFVS